MGQIVQKASNPVRCNLAAIQAGGSQANVVLDDGEVWFVDTTNAEKGTDGYGHYDAYIVGDGTKKASALVVKQIDDMSAFATKQELATKQDVINDLATIRSGAQKGNTAYQKPNSGIPKSDLAQEVQTSLNKADAAAPQSTTYTKNEVDEKLSQIDVDVDITDVLGENYYADEEGLYIQRSDGNVYPISHPDLSTQPSVLPQRFGVFPLKEVLVPNLTNSATFIADAEIVPLGVTIIDVSVFNANECVSGHTKKENGSIVITNEQGIVPDFALIRYYGEGGNYYYDSSYSGGGSDDEQEEQGIEITPARYLTFTAQQSGSSIGLAHQATNHKVYYSKDGHKWKELGTSTNIALQSGETVYIIGDSSNVSAFSSSNYTQFAMNGRIAANGDITSILDYETLDEKNADYCYYRMFRDCTSLTTAPELPATTLANYCYNDMFHGCTSLTQAPTLPATTLASNCYYSMFYGCTSLTQAPTLPATTLATGCYSSMFNGCTSLTQAPTLPATTLAQNCYTSMFYGCTSLTQAPTLPATTLATGCYSSMFYGCTSLTQAPTLPATTLASNCYYSMFHGCTSLTQAPTLPATTLAQNCYTSMFYGCTSLTQAPTLPATTLATGCYSSMFNGCTSLTQAPTLPATTLAQSCYRAMFYGCTSLTQAPTLPATTLAIECYSSMFNGCTSLTQAPTLPATTLAQSCYRAMFYDCSRLNSITCLATNISALNCVTIWMDGVASTGTFTKAASMTSWPSGESGIPNGWTVVDYVEQ